MSRRYRDDEPPYFPEMQIQMKVEIVSDTPHGGLFFTQSVNSNPEDAISAVPQFPLDWFKQQAAQSRAVDTTAMLSLTEAAADASDTASALGEDGKPTWQKKKKKKHGHRDKHRVHDVSFASDTSPNVQTPVSADDDAARPPDTLPAAPPHLHSDYFYEQRRPTITEIQPDEKIALNTFEDDQAEKVSPREKPIVELAADTSFEDEHDGRRAVQLPIAHLPVHTLTETTTTTTTVEVFKTTLEDGQAPPPIDLLQARAAAPTATGKDGEQYEVYSTRHQETLLNDPAFLPPPLPRPQPAPRRRAIQPRRDFETLIDDPAVPEPPRSSTPPSEPKFHHHASAQQPPLHTSHTQITSVTAYDVDVEPIVQPKVMAIAPIQVTSFESTLQPPLTHLATQFACPSPIVERRDTTLLQEEVTRSIWSPGIDVTSSTEPTPSLEHGRPREQALSPRVKLVGSLISSTPVQGVRQHADAFPPPPSALTLTHASEMLVDYAAQHRLMPSSKIFELYTGGKSSTPSTSTHSTGGHSGAAANVSQDLNDDDGDTEETASIGMPLIVGPSAAQRQIYTIPEAYSREELEMTSVSSVRSRHSGSQPRRPPPDAPTTTKKAAGASSVDSERSSLSGAVRAGAAYVQRDGGSDIDNLSDYLQDRLTPLNNDWGSRADTLRSQDSVISEASLRADQTFAMYDERTAARRPPERSFADILRTTSPNPRLAFIDEVADRRRRSPEAAAAAATEMSSHSTSMSSSTGSLREDTTRVAQLVRRDEGGPETVSALSDRMRKILEREEKQLRDKKSTVATPL